MRVACARVALPAMFSDRRVALVTAALAAILPVATASAFTVHVVQPGETLSAIAAQYGLPLEVVAADNGIGDPNRIYAGQELTIDGPGPTSPHALTYVVRPGDTLSAIAADHGVTLDALLGVNGLVNPDVILEGQVLVIPGAYVRPTRWVSHAEAEAALRQAEIDYGLEPGLLRALAWQESGWQQHVVSRSGAVGLTQLLPSTAAWALEWLAPHAHEWYTDPRHNADMGAAILRHWLFLTGGDLRLALAAYYQGWGNLQAYGIFPETEQYVANVLTLVPRFAE